MRRASGCWRLRLGACSVRLDTDCSGQGLARFRASPQKQADSPCTSGKSWNGPVGWRVRICPGLAAGPESPNKRCPRFSRMGPEGGAEFREVTQSGTARKSLRSPCSA